MTPTGNLSDPRQYNDTRARPIHRNSDRSAPALTGPSPAQEKKYATHSINYNRQTLDLKIKLTDDNGVIYKEGAKLPPKLVKEIDTAAREMLKCAADKNLFSTENPISQFNSKGFVTKDGASHRMDHTKEWQVFTDTVGWSKKPIDRSSAPADCDRAKSNLIMPIIYPKAAVPAITGPGLVLLGKDNSYDQLPSAVKLRILNSLLINPTVATRGIYKEVQDQLTKTKKTEWTPTTTEEEKQNDIQKAIREEIQTLKQQLPQNQFLDDVDRDLIDSLYADFLTKAPGEIKEEITWKIKHLMNRKFPKKETLVEHYRAICRAKQIPLPAFTNTPEAFSDYWFNYTHSTTPAHAEAVTNFVEAMVSWADTEGVKLDKNYLSANRPVASPILSKVLSLLDRIPRLTDYVPESFKGRSNEGLGKPDNAYDVVLAAASYLALPIEIQTLAASSVLHILGTIASVSALAAAKVATVANQAITASQALVAASPVLPILGTIASVPALATAKVATMANQALVAASPVIDSVSALAAAKVASVANQAITAIQALTVDSPTCGLVEDVAASSVLPILGTIASVSALAAGIYYKGEQITDWVINANDWIYNTGNEVAQKMETPTKHAKTLLSLAASVAAWLPTKAYEAAKAGYKYGPYQRTKQAVQGVHEAFASKPAGKK